MKELTKLKDKELEQLHIEASLDLASLARLMSDTRSKIDELSNYLDDVELELEGRNAKKQSKFN